MVAGWILWSELSVPCPPGGPLAVAGCGTLRTTLLGVVGIGAVVYVAGLSAILVWLRGLARRRVADPRAQRDWYLLGATIGLPIALLLAFTIVSALR